MMRIKVRRSLCDDLCKEVSAFLLSIVIQDICYPFLQFGQLGLYDIPDNIVIDTKIMMNYPIPCTRHLFHSISG